MASAFLPILPHQAAPFFRTVLDEVPAPLVVFDAQRRYLYCNKSAIQNDEIRAWVIGHDDFEYCAYRGFDVALAQKRQAHFEQAQALGGTVSFEETFETPSGTVRQQRYITPLYTPQGELQYFLGYGLDVTALRQAEADLQRLNQELEARVAQRTLELQQATWQLAHEALHDALTGLPNRTLFGRRLGSALQVSGTDNPAHALFLLDVDHFKSVNDAHGHPVGDGLLVALAQRLGHWVGQWVGVGEGTQEASVLARLGGDEFGLLLPIAAPQDALGLAQDCLSLLAQPFLVAGHELLISGSVGVVFLEGYQEASEVLRDADIALYHAKAAERGHYQVFNAQLRQEVLSRIATERELRQALRRGELRVFYQPIMNLRTGRLSGFEALLRWQHPTRGLLTPYHFLQVAEDSGLIVELDRWALRAAVEQFSAWTAGLTPASPLKLSVNVSGKHFLRRNLVAELSGLVERYGLRPGQLRLELTESVLLDHSGRIGDLLAQIRALGVGLHIDDFGTGYSSLSYLQSYPLDTLKIDRSFVMKMHERSSAELIRTIIAMSKNLRMQVTAEGIETAEQLQKLSLMHCDYGQGYYFSPPMDAEKAQQFFKEWI